MKVVHFALMSPNQAGLYGTVKDLIFGERANGIEADIVDYGFEGKDQERLLEDGWLKCVHWQEALLSDLVIRHSATPQAVINKVPYLLALHGRPINTFLISFQYGRKEPIIEAIYKASKQKMFSGFISFWDYNTRIWREILYPSPVYQVPAPVDLERFKPYGQYHKFKGNYDFRILIADMWREDSCPVTPLFRALEVASFLEKTKGIRIQINAVGVPKRARELLEHIRTESKNPYIGEIIPMINNIELVYRSSDAVLTGHRVSTRVVRESFACGTPVLTTDQSPDFEPSFQGDLAKAIIFLMARGRKITREESRSYAKTAFDPVRTGAVMKSLFEKILGGENETRSCL